MNQLETIARVLAQAGWRDAGGLELRSPLSVLMDKEAEVLAELELEASGAGRRLVEGLRAEAPSRELRRDLAELAQALTKEAAREQYLRSHGDFLSWLFADGPNPLRVVKRLFCYAKKVRPELLLNLSFRTLGDLLGDGGGANSGAALHAQCVALFGKENSLGAHKSASARAAMKKAQRHNKNRRGGK